jgi:hypothetical protein
MLHSDSGDHQPQFEFGLVSEAELGHGSSKPGEAESNPLGDKADLHGIAHLGAIDPIYQPSLESASDDDR